MKEYRENLTFGEAVELLKNGFKVSRGGWKKDAWLSLSPGALTHSSKFWSKNNADFAKSQPDGSVYVSSCITIKNPDDKIVMGWVPTQDDMLSNDWILA